MFQLILGISLGLILLFVLVLLVTEMAATYPVWKHFKMDLSAHPGNPAKPPGTKKRLAKVVLVTLLAIASFCTIAQLVNGFRAEKEDRTAAAETKPVNQPADFSAKKYLSDSVSTPGLRFASQIKWEEGKMYCNNRVLFENEPAWNFTDCHYSFLDKEGFLITDIHFSQTDFVTETKAGRMTALLNRSNISISFGEYQRIAQLQVVLDNKLSRE